MANVFHAFRLTKFALFLIVFVSILLILSRRKTNFVDQNFVPIDGPKNIGNSRALIIGGECMERVASNGQCQFPIEIAIFTLNQIPSEFVNKNELKIVWTVEDRAEKDFWLFREAKNSTNAIAVKKFTTRQSKIALGNNSHFLVEFPADLAKFHKKWRNGRFIECEVVLKRNETETQRFMPLTMIDRAAELTAHMEAFNLTGILFGGTLLGWRRECSLIPHTGDLDIALLHREHSLAFLESILHSQKFLLKWMLGHPKEGFEMTLWMDNFKTDIFYIYYNETRRQSFMTGMRVEKRQRLYWYYPRIEEAFCTGEMGGHLFHVPCNVDDILAAEYGAEGWKVDFPTSQFFYDKSHKNKESGEIMPEAEWEGQYNLYYPKEEHNQTLPKWGRE